MNLKSNKGYSLVEIGVGLLILTVFLICSVALFNGCYNTYRMIQQRNLALNTAISNMEEMLQTDSDILTGFFTEEYDTNNESYLVANTVFSEYVDDNFDSKFRNRYALLNGLSSGDEINLSTEEFEDYLYLDREFLINSYIQDEVESYSDAQFESEDVQKGNYGLLVQSVTESGNPNILNPGTSTENVIIGEMAVRKTILRLPLTSKTAYGNNILKLKVEVLYTNKINTSNLSEDDIKVITLDSIKIAD
ncbi:MAG: hypothetical protein J6C46_06315 [Clostridia bacterium]|nr:hypothetical protein [Clostridia bacterium]